MPRTCRSVAASLAVLSLAACALFVPAPAAARDPDRKVRAARWVLEELLLGDERIVPEPLLRQTRCLAIFPSVTEAAFGLGGSHGRGVASCRGEDGVWSPPAFLTISGGSVGLQVGFQRVDLLLFFVTAEGTRSLATPHFSLGGTVSVAAGPLDRRAGVSVDPLYDRDVYLYSRARGLFAGLAMDGSRIGGARRLNESYYGERLWPEQILFEGKADAVPAEGLQLVAQLATLPDLVPGAGE